MKTRIVITKMARGILEPRIIAKDELEGSQPVSAEVGRTDNVEVATDAAGRSAEY